MDDTARELRELLIRSTQLEGTTELHEHRLNAHGQNQRALEIEVAQGSEFAAATSKVLDNHQETLKLLRSEKVSLDRYVWVERIVMGLAGALLLRVLQAMVGHL